MENKIKQLLIINKFEHFFKKAYKIRTAAIIPRLLRLIYNNPSLDLTWTQFCRNGWLKNTKNFYLLNLQLLISSLPKYAMVKKIIKNLTIMTFCPLQDNKPLLKASDLVIVKKKLMVVTTNPLVCYIFSKVCL